MDLFIEISLITDNEKSLELHSISRHFSSLNTLFSFEALSRTKQKQKNSRIKRFLLSLETFHCFPLEGKHRRPCQAIHFDYPLVSPNDAFQVLTQDIEKNELLANLFVGRCCFTVGRSIRDVVHRVLAQSLLTALNNGQKLINFSFALLERYAKPLGNLRLKSFNYILSSLLINVYQCI